MLARSSDISYASGEVSVWYKLCQKCARYVNRDSCGIRRSRKGILSGMGEFKEWYKEREWGEGGKFQNGNNDYTALWYQFVPGHDGA